MWLLGRVLLANWREKMLYRLTGRAWQEDSPCALFLPPGFEFFNGFSRRQIFCGEPGKSFE